MIDLVVKDKGLESLNYIKMGIEGGEIDTIAGSGHSIGKFRPIISLEYGIQADGAYSYKENSLFDVSAELGYRIFDPFMQDIGNRDVWDFAKSRYCWDYFIIPEERVLEARKWSALSNFR